MGPQYIDDVGILEALESLNFARLPLEEGDYWCKACYIKAYKHACRPRFTPPPDPTATATVPSESTAEHIGECWQRGRKRDPLRPEEPPPRSPSVSSYGAQKGAFNEERGDRNCSQVGGDSGPPQGQSRHTDEVTTSPSSVHAHVHVYRPYICIFRDQKAAAGDCERLARIGIVLSSSLKPEWSN